MMLHLNNNNLYQRNVLTYHVLTDRQFVVIYLNKRSLSYGIYVDLLLLKIVCLLKVENTVSLSKGRLKANAVDD